jgi:hypothetical protein
MEPGTGNREQGKKSRGKGARNPGLRTEFKAVFQVPVSLVQRS